MHDERPDGELMALVARGDAAALESLYSRWERPLYQFLARHTGGRDVDDLHQETWLRVVRASARYDPARRFSTWLFQIALNLCRVWGRRPPPEPVDPASIPAPVAEHADRDTALDVERLLSALSEEQRAAVVLRYCHDLPEDEVAVILDIPRGTVKSRLHAAVRRLVALAREPRGRP
jgi:RNA polymerase sigma-70 factor (ECF subfamily)